MNFFKDKFFEITGYYFYRNTPPLEQPRKITKFQVYFEKVYHILSWENISLTLAIFLALNYLFWLMVQLEVRILGFIFSLFLLLFIWDSFFANTEQLTSNAKYSDVFDNTRIIVYDTILNLKSFRKENPSTFCISLSLAFFILRLIATTISGYEAVYCLLLLTFFLPLGFKMLPEEKAENYKNSIKSIFNITGILAEEELIPFISDKDFANRDNDLDSLLTDRTADSVSTSLISGISAMPSYLDVGEMQNDVQEEDLLPNRNITGDFSSESDSEHREISFASSHFSRDSSSEDERLLEKDISFNNVEEESKNSTFPGTLLNMVKSIVYKNDTPVKRQDSDGSSTSSSDFEFVNTDDIK